MFWTTKAHFLNDPFEIESQMEAAIAEVSATLFGPNRIYLDVKKLIGGKGKIRDIPNRYAKEGRGNADPQIHFVSLLRRFDQNRRASIRFAQRTYIISYYNQ